MRLHAVVLWITLNNEKIEVNSIFSAERVADIGKWRINIKNLRRSHFAWGQTIFIYFQKSNIDITFCSLISNCHFECFVSSISFRVAVVTDCDKLFWEEQSRNCKENNCDFSENEYYALAIINIGENNQISFFFFFFLLLRFIKNKKKLSLTKSPFYPISI